MIPQPNKIFRADQLFEQRICGWGTQTSILPPAHRWPIGNSARIVKVGDNNPVEILLTFIFKYWPYQDSIQIPHTSNWTCECNTRSKANGS